MSLPLWPPLPAVLNQFHSFPIGLQSVCSPSAFSPPYASCEFYALPPGRQPHCPFLAISPHPNAAKFQPFPFNIHAAYVTCEFHFLSVCLHLCRTCQALHPLPAQEQFQPLPHRHPRARAPQRPARYWTRLRPRPRAASRLFPPQVLRLPHGHPRRPNLSNLTVTAFAAPEGSWSLTWSCGLRCAGYKTHGSLLPLPGYTLVCRDRPGFSYPTRCPVLSPRHQPVLPRWSNHWTPGYPGQPRWPPNLLPKHLHTPLYLLSSWLPAWPCPFTRCRLWCRCPGHGRF